MGYARVYWAVCFDGQLGSFIYNHFVKTKLDSKGHSGSGVGVIYAISCVIITAIVE